MNDTLIIVPAFNEERSIEQVIDEIRDQKICADLLIIDDGSVDKTPEIIRAMGCHVLSLYFNCGYGIACQAGFKYAVERNYQYIMKMDSDGQHRAFSLPAILAKLKEGQSDIVIGSRFLSEEKYKSGRVRKVAIGLFRIIIKLSTGAVISDPSSGLQGMNRKAFTFCSKADNYAEDYPDADVLIKLLRSGFKVQEVPAEFRERVYGKGMHTGLKPVYYMAKMLVSILVVLITYGKNGRRVKDAR